MCGSAAMSAMSITGPTAASAAASSATTSACVRVEHHALINASSSMRCCARPANPANRSSSPTPSSASTRAATLSLLVDTATHFPSRHWYVPRGTV